jgi:hypothetical protein
MAENGRVAYMAWTVHYNGEGKLSKRTAIAKSKLENLHYKNEHSMSFEHCTEVMTKCFNTLHKDPDQRYFDREKVEKLLRVIRCQDPELLAARSLSTSNTRAILSAPVVISRNKWLAYTNQRSWNIDRTNIKSVVYMQLIAEPVTAEGLEAILAAEVD